MHVVFVVLNLVVLPFWAVMILAPGWRGTRRMVESPWVVALPAAAYVAMVIPSLPALASTLSNPTLDAVSAELASPRGAVLAWAHFVTMDLFVGRWMYLDGRRRDYSSWGLGPALFLTLMTGPLGLLSYLVGRNVAETVGPSSR